MRTVNVEQPVYLLAATVADPSQCSTFRDRLFPLRTSERKLHWRNLDRRHRNSVIDVISSLDLHHIVVAAKPLDPRKQERARARCLERMAWELGRLGVSQFILEARPTSLMKKDRQIIDALRGRGGLPVSLRVDHGLPSEDPMLWVPDQVLGATGAAMEGNSEWMDKIGSTTEVVHIDL